MNNSKNRRFVNAKWFSTVGLFLFLLITFSSCEKHVTERRVKRIITKDSWMITKYVFEGEDISDEFQYDEFAFEDAGSILVLNNDTITGHWGTGLDKPTMFYLSAFNGPKFDRLNDDYTFLTLNKSNFKIQADNGAIVNTITFIKLE
jgi:hypothetical protein